MRITVRPHTAVFALSVKIQTVASRMVKHAVQNHADIGFLRFFKQRPKRSLTAKHTVDLKIVTRIVFVVGIGAKDGTEVDHTHPKGFQIAQLFGDPPKVSAKKHIVGKLVSVLFCVLRNPVLPIAVHDHVASLLHSTFAAKETIHENMIHDPPLEPAWRGKITIVNRQRKASVRMGREREIHLVLGGSKQRIDASQKQKLIKEQSASVLAAKGRRIQGKLVGVRSQLGFKERQGKIPILPPIPTNTQNDRRRPKLSRDFDGKGYDFANGERPPCGGVLAVYLFSNHRLNRWRILHQHQDFLVFFFVMGAEGSVIMRSRFQICFA